MIGLPDSVKQNKTKRKARILEFQIMRNIFYLPSYIYMCQIAHETYLSYKIIYLKFKCNWVPCVSPGNPTHGRMQKSKARGLEPPLPLVGHRETKNKNNTDNEPRSHYDGYAHRPRSQWERTITTPNAVAGNTLRFPQSWFCKCF